MTISAALKKLLKEADARLEAQAQGSDTIIEAAVVVAVQLTSQTEEDDALAQADAEPASKKRRVPTSKGAKKPKAGPKAKAKSRAAPCQVREPDLCHLIIRSTDTDSRGMYDERPCNALDDLIQAIRNRSVAETYVLDEVPEPQDKATFAFCASIGLEFIFSEKVAVNGKGFAVYTGLRPELGGIRHAGTLKIQAGDKSLTPLEMSRKLMEFVNMPITVTVGAADAGLQRLQDAMTDLVMVERFKLFIKHQLVLPLKMQTPLTNTIRALYMMTATIGACDKLVDVMQIVADCMFREFSPQWIMVANETSDLWDEGGVMPAIALPLFHSAASLEHVLIMRPLMTVFVMRELLSMSCLHPNIQGLENNRLVNLTTLVQAMMAEVPANKPNEFPPQEYWKLISAYDAVQASGWRRVG